MEKPNFLSNSYFHKSFLWKPTILLIFLGFTEFPAFAQVNIQAEAFVSPASRTISIKQEISFFNSSKDSLERFYLNDWNHAFSSKSSPLAKHFSSTYLRKYHFSNQSQRGETRIDHIRTENLESLQWKR